eukprot:PITA_23272
MLHDQGLPLHLWIEACNAAAYLQNRSPHHILGMKTPEEAFFGKRPDVGHFRIFGSSVYCHVTNDAWKKLESTTELGILVWYTDTPYNYQVEGIDYDETFSPTARYSSIRSMLALSTHMGWKIHQMDVKTAFLNGNIREEVYIEQSEGFETFDRESHVCRLKRDLYGLKQAPCAWYTRIDNYFTGLGFIKSEVDANLYHIMVKVWQKDGELFVSQGKYANEIHRTFHMEKCKPMQTPLIGNWRKEDATSREVVEATVYRQFVGSLMYLVNTRLDLCYSMNQLSQAMVQPTKMFWKATKHVWRYLIGTSQYGLWYKWIEVVKL